MEGWQNLTERQPRFQLDEHFYKRLRAAKATYRRAGSFVISAAEGRAFQVQKGQTFRVVEETAAQIGTVAFWSASDHRENFKATRTWAQEGVYIKPYTQMLSTEPWVRPMITCIEQTVSARSEAEGYQHHTVGPHCSHEIIQMWFGREATNSCHQNLIRAIESWGMREDDLRDTINLHQKVKLSDPHRGHIYLAASDAKKGDYIEFYAEIDLLVAVSVCPLGDGTANPIGDLFHVNPLRVEIYDTGFEPRIFPRCSDWRPNWTGKWGAG